VKAARELARLSQGDVVKRLKALDVRIGQATIARLETGTRRTSVDDLLAIAAAIGVSPLHLLAASFTHDTVKVTPKLEAGPQRMRQWLKGEMPLWGTDEERFFELVPDEERLARQRRGLVYLEQCVRDFTEAAVAQSPGAMRDAMKDLLRELERQKDQLDREERKAKKESTDV